MACEVPSWPNGSLSASEGSLAGQGCGELVLWLKGDLHPKLWPRAHSYHCNYREQILHGAFEQQHWTPGVKCNKDLSCLVRVHVSPAPLGISTKCVFGALNSPSHPHKKLLEKARPLQRGCSHFPLFWKQQPLLRSLEPVVAIPACDQNGGIVRLPARAMAKPD